MLVSYLYSIEFSVKPHRSVCACMYEHVCLCGCICRCWVGCVLACLRTCMSSCLYGVSQKKLIYNLYVYKYGINSDRVKSDIRNNKGQICKMILSYDVFKLLAGVGKTLKTWLNVKIWHFGNFYLINFLCRRPKDRACRPKLITNDAEFVR